jgi:hypothetical protein
MTTDNPAESVLNVIGAVYDAWAANDADAFLRRRRSWASATRGTRSQS